MLRISTNTARQPIPTAFAIALGLSSFLSYPALAQIPISTLLSQNPPPAPRTPPPDNQTKPGGGLDPSNSSCKSTNRPLTALIPVKNPVLTTSKHPTFLFYVPYASDEVRYGEFSLLVWPEEKTRLYKARFTLPQTPGIVSITLPSAPEYALAEGQYYHWYLKLYCQTNTSSQPDLDVNGSVQRVALTPERERQIQAATPDVWYDASANLAESLRASPQDASLRNKWVNLLKFINSEHLAQEPLVGSVIPIQDRYEMTLTINASVSWLLSQRASSLPQNLRMKVYREPSQKFAATAKVLSDGIQNLLGEMKSTTG